MCFCGFVEREGVSLARAFYVSSGGDASGTLDLMPKGRNVERSLLVGLQKHGEAGNYLAAFNHVRQPQSVS